MFEKYTADYAKFDEPLRTLADAADNGTAEAKELAELPPSQKAAMYEDWMRRAILRGRRPPPAWSPGMPNSFSIARSKTVVCGNGEQRAAALEFLELSAAPAALDRVERLKRWALERRIPDLTERINAAHLRLKEILDAELSILPKT